MIQLEMTPAYCVAILRQNCAQAFPGSDTGRFSPAGGEWTPAAGCACAQPGVLTSRPVRSTPRARSARNWASDGELGATQSLGPVGWTPLHWNVTRSQRAPSAQAA